MQEIEAKFFISDLDSIRKRLQSLEAHLIQERVLEKNIRFDLPDGGLRSKGQVLRLRQDTQPRLTYKSGSTNQQGVLNRREIEFVVEDFEKARQFLEALGYQKMFYYEKYRTTFELLQTSGTLKDIRGHAHVMLDELPYGNFVEIEGESFEFIRVVADELKINWGTAIPTSYYILFDQLCKRHPEINPEELSFSMMNGHNISVAELPIHAGDG